MTARFESLLLILIMAALLAVPASADLNDIYDLHHTDLSKYDDLILIDSYDAVNEWSAPITNTIIEKCNENGLYFRNVEYMNLARLPESEGTESFDRLFRERYSEYNFRTVIAVDSYAVNYVINNYHDLFEGADVVYCGVFMKPANIPEDIADHFTGVFSPAATDSIRFIVKNSPVKINTVYVIAGVRANVQTLARNYDPLGEELGVKMEYLSSSGMTIDEFRDFTASLPSDSAVFVTLIYTDAAGNHFGELGFERLISETTSVPVLSMIYDFDGMTASDLPTGYLGGIMKDPKHIGQIASDIVLAVRKGEIVQEAEDSTAIPVFNSRSLERFAIPYSSLPDDSIIIAGVEDPVGRIKVLLVLAMGGIILVGFGILISTIVIVHYFRAKKRIRNSHRIIDTLTTGGHLCLFDIDINAHKSFFSDNSESILGSSPARLAEMPYAKLLSKMHPDDYRNIYRSHLDIVEREGTCTRHFSYSARYKLNGSKYKYFEFNVKYTAVDGRLTRVMGTIEDISERHELAAGLNKAIDRMYILSAVSRNYFYDKANTLIGNIKVIESVPSLSPERKAAVMDMSDAAKKILRQVEFTNNYFVRSNTRGWHSLKSLITEAYEGIMPTNVLITMHNADVIIDISLMFENVLMMIFENSKKHVGNNACIDAAFVENDDGSGSIIITDNGKGISADKKEKIFEKSSFGESTHSLYLARALLESGGETIIEDGEEGKGIRFVISIPLGRWKYPEDINSGKFELVIPNDDKDDEKVLD